MTVATESEALKAWETASERTDLVARLGFATLADYRSTLPLPAVLLNQLDRFEQARLQEDAAHDLLEHVRGTA